MCKLMFSGPYKSCKELEQLLQSGRISNRNRVHLKMDHTPPIVQQQLPTQSPDCVQNDVQPDVETSTSDEIEHCDNSSEQLPPVATPQQQPSEQ